MIIPAWGRGTLWYGIIPFLVVGLVALLAACGKPAPAPTQPQAAAPTPAQAVAPAQPAPVAAPPSPAPTPTAIPKPAATVPAAAPSPSVAARAGTVEVRVTDAPPEGVSEVLVTLTKIEAQRSGATGESGWATIVESPPVFDLVAVTGLEQVLGTNALPEGSYTQVRMSVAKVVVTVQGRDREAEIPGDKLRVAGRFQVAADKTTVLTLDFDADKSIVLAGQKVLVKPVVKLLTREPSDKPDPPKRRDQAVKTPTPAGTLPPGPATPTPKPP